MRTSRHLLATALVMALVAACSPTMRANVAAVVDGHEITRASVEEATTTLMGDISGMDADTRGNAVGEVQREVLTLFVIERVFVRAANDAGIEVSDDAVAEAREQALAQVGGADDLDAALERARLTHEVFDLIVSYQAHDQALRAHLLEGTEQISRESRHILLETEEEAQQVIDDLAEGADFADVAEERSQDPGSAQDGGQLGFQVRGMFVDAFDEAIWEASLDEVVGPIETEFGFHVLEVTDEASVPVDEMTEGEVAQAIAAPYDDIIGRAAAEAEVEVAESIGRWDPESLTVIPPLDDAVGQAPETEEPAEPPVPGDEPLLPDEPDAG